MQIFFGRTLFLGQYALQENKIIRHLHVKVLFYVNDVKVWNFLDQLKLMFILARCLGTKIVKNF